MKDINERLSIGDEIKYLRILLELSQKKFGELILLSRATINRIEQKESPEDVKEKALFRLYFLVQQIIEDPNKPDYTKQQASKLKLMITEYLQSRINSIILSRITKKLDVSNLPTNIP